MGKKSTFSNGIILLVSVLCGCSSIKKKIPDNNTDTTYKKIHVKELGNTIDIFPTVYDPDRCSRLLAKNIPLVMRKGLDVLDIGTGSGIQGLISAKHGAKKVIVTDINPAAIENVRHNAALLGLSDTIKPRLVTRHTGIGAFDVIKKEEVFDLILFGPPFNDRQFQKSFFSGVNAHLKPVGIALFYSPELSPFLSDEARKNNLKIELIDMISVNNPCSLFTVFANNDNDSTK